MSGAEHVVFETGQLGADVEISILADEEAAERETSDVVHLRRRKVLARELLRSSA